MNVPRHTASSHAFRPHALAVRLPAIPPPAPPSRLPPRHSAFRPDNGTCDMVMIFQLF